MPTVTKKDLIDRIAEATDQKRVDVKRTVQSFLDQVILELGKGNRLEFRDFGVFEIRERKARTAQNPKTLERVEVPAKKVVKFKVGRLMQQSLESGPIAIEPGSGPEIHVRTRSADAHPAQRTP
ncbi:MAG: HU family DNA-binding protein [Planctomycetota bacterium]